MTTESRIEMVKRVSPKVEEYSKLITDLVDNFLDDMEVEMPELNQPDHPSFTLSNKVLESVLFCIIENFLIKSFTFVATAQPSKHHAIQTLNASMELVGSRAAQDIQKKIDKFFKGVK